jgi:hypothetical protein
MSTGATPGGPPGTPGWFRSLWSSGDLSASSDGQTILAHMICEPMRNRGEAWSMTALAGR